MVLSCIDPRFQPIVYNYLKKEKLNGRYSSFTIAGAAIGVTFSKLLSIKLFSQTISAGKGVFHLAAQAPIANGGEL